MDKDGVCACGAINPTHWGAAVNASGTLFIATAGFGSQPMNPINMIINGNTSSNFNTDGLTNTNQQPFIQGPGTFSLTVPGLTSATSITSVSFEFGTGPEADFVVPGPIVGAGLPGLVIACSGLVALARRRRQKIA